MKKQAKILCPKMTTIQKSSGTRETCNLSSEASEFRNRFPALEFLLGKFGGPSTVIYRVRYILCFFRNLKEPQASPSCCLT
ncbi:hypothetical protein NC653_039888 [Populus alba x Populus x berolinensis]|uniref:Uncharacterized protein n=1 Tax=Populus alba x Populus x berolinensis TaxID=444605 RepID=A0AAD6LCG7_9ROSI|nr:hypothetical protein NC653_039888 [Populus alba x Populus x berolinensis]KAJ6958069.1 hypothetical protein NC653_039888 [Populus alba x Populus x berolinensis]